MALQPAYNVSSRNVGPVLNSPSKQLVEEDGTTRTLPVRQHAGPPLPPAPPQQQTRGRSDPNMLSTADTSDALSPTTLVLNYLKSKGYQPTAENIRRTIEANARDPGVLGPSSVGREADSAGPWTDLRNAAPENSSPATSRRPAPPRDASNPAGTPVDASNPALMPGEGGPPPNSQYVPMPNAGAPDVGKMIIGGGPPPSGMAPVPGVPPVMPPPPAGAAVALPTDPMSAALDKAVTPQLPAPPAQLALPAPAEMPALPAPPVRPQIAGPPGVPALPAPSQPLALPAPNRPLALPAPDVQLPGNLGEPQGEPGGRVRIGNVTPKAPPISPENPVIQSPLSNRVRGAATGALSGAATGRRLGGGPGAAVGAIGGGLLGAAPEIKNIVPYIMKNLHLS